MFWLSKKLCSLHTTLLITFAIATHLYNDIYWNFLCLLLFSSIHRIFFKYLSLSFSHMILVAYNSQFGRIFLIFCLFQITFVCSQYLNFIFFFYTSEHEKKK